MSVASDKIVSNPICGKKIKVDAVPGTVALLTGDARRGHGQSDGTVRSQVQRIGAVRQRADRMAGAEYQIACRPECPLVLRDRPTCVAAFRGRVHPLRTDVGHGIPYSVAGLPPST